MPDGLSRLQAVAPVHASSIHNAFVLAQARHLLDDRMLLLVEQVGGDPHQLELELRDRATLLTQEWQAAVRAGEHDPSATLLAQAQAHSAVANYLRFMCGNE